MLEGKTMTVKITTIYASDDESLAEKLNELNATRIVSVESFHDDEYRIIYEVE